MNDRRRTATKTILTLESLDTRVVPSMVGLSGAGHTGISAHVAVHAHAHATTHTAAKPAHHAAAHGKSAPLMSFGGGFSFPATASFAPAGGAVGAAPSVSTPVATTGTASDPSVSAGAISLPPAQSPPSVSTSPAASATATTNATPASTGSGTAATPAVSTGNSDALAKAGNDLAGLYQSFTANGTTSPYSRYMQISGSSVNVDIQGSGDFNAFKSALTSLGLQVNATDSQNEIVEGLLPINQILAAAQLSQTVGMHGVYKPALQ